MEMCGFRNMVPGGKGQQKSRRRSVGYDFHFGRLGNCLLVLSLFVCGLIQHATGNGTCGHCP